MIKTFNVTVQRSKSSMKGTDVMEKNVIVAGAGASGLVAAICAARAGAKVTVIEQMDKPAKKILATGNGRCNYTNEKMDASCFHSENMELVKYVISRTGTREVLDFFENLGILPKCRDGYYYPHSMQAASVAEVLLSEAERLDVTIVCSEKVTEVQKKKSKFAVTTDRRTIEADAVILATGGMATPALGSDGSGYRLARSLGLHLTDIQPALTGFRCQGRFLKKVKGVRVRARVTLRDLTKRRKIIGTDVGELQMTDYGISGIPVFQVSAAGAKALADRHDVLAVIDFMPDYADDVFERMLVRRFKNLSWKTALDCLVGMLPWKLIHLVLASAAIDDDRMAGSVDIHKVSELAFRIKHFELKVLEIRDFSEAQVCAGGVRTEDVDRETMMVKKLPGLYITGELLDVDGICGGYNLHFAWASGMAAGTHAGKVVNR